MSLDSISGVTSVWCSGASGTVQLVLVDLDLCALLIQSSCSQSALSGLLLLLLFLLYGYTLVDAVLRVVSCVVMYNVRQRAGQNCFADAHTACSALDPAEYARTQHPEDVFRPAA